MPFFSASAAASSLAGDLTSHWTPDIICFMYTRPRHCLVDIENTLSHLSSPADTIKSSSSGCTAICRIPPWCPLNLCATFCVFMSNPKRLPWLFATYATLWSWFICSDVMTHSPTGTSMTARFSRTSYRLSMCSPVPTKNSRQSVPGM